MHHQTWQRFLQLSLCGLFGFVLIAESFLASARWIDRPFPGFFVHENLTVGPYFVPGWSGATAGLQTLDRIARMDGQELGSRAELYDNARRATPGSAVRYQVVRGTQSLESDDRYDDFDLADWLLSFGVYSVVGLAFLIIGVAPYFYRAASPVALPLCFMVLTVFVWFQTTFDFMSESLLPKELRIFALCLTPSAAIHLALMLQSGGLVHKVRSLSSRDLCGRYDPRRIEQRDLFLPTDLWTHFSRRIHLRLSRRLKLSRHHRHGAAPKLVRPRSFTLAGDFCRRPLGFFAAGVDDRADQRFPYQIPYNLALVPTVFFPISVAYALLKYSLFDLGNALRVGLSRVGLFALLVALYVSVAFLVAPWLGDHANGPLVPVFFSVLVVAVFNPLLRGLEGMVDRYIFRQDYDPVPVQREVSLCLRSLDSAPALAQGFIDRLMLPLGVDNAVVLYHSKAAERTWW